MNDCLFCKIVSGDIPCREVASSDNLLAFEDLTPQAPLHVLIIPKIHIESLLDLTEETAPLIGDTSWQNRLPKREVWPKRVSELLVTAANLQGRLCSIYIFICWAAGIYIGRRGKRKKNSFSGSARF
jgi:histidine triad (HIT) family protein